MSFSYEVPESTLGVVHDGRTVTISIRVHRTGGESFRFTFDAGSVWAAHMLANAIREQLASVMERARSDAYELGWRDKSAKRPKRSSFWGRLP